MGRPHNFGEYSAAHRERAFFDAPETSSLQIALSPRTQPIDMNSSSSPQHPSLQEAPSFHSIIQKARSHKPSHRPNLLFVVLQLQQMVARYFLCLSVRPLPTPASSARVVGGWNSFVSVAFGSYDTISGLLLMSLVYISNHVAFSRTFLRFSLQKLTKTTWPRGIKQRR